MKRMNEHNENMNTRVGLAPRRRRIIHCTGVFLDVFPLQKDKIDKRESSNEREYMYLRERERDTPTR